MKKLTALVLALLLALSLGACGSKEDSTLYGTYDLYALDYENSVLLAGEFFSGENYITLKSGGSAEMCLENDKANVRWKMEGEKLTVTAADGDMVGGISNGILTLTMDGTRVYFLGKNASKDSLKAVTMDELLNGAAQEAIQQASQQPANSEPAAVNTPEAASDLPASPTAVQQMWNGWYYGCIDLSGCTGGWEAVNGLTFDAAMQVELDEDGTGNLIVYDPYGAFATNPEHNNRYVVINCHADASYLYGDSGTAFDRDINTADWRVVRNQENPDKLNVGSSHKEEDGSKLGYDFTFLPWGDRWEKETYQQFIPHFTEYLAKLDEGWTDPFGGQVTADTPATPSGAPSGGNSELLGSSPAKLDINDRGVATVLYPADQFVYDDLYGKLKNEKTGVGILMDPMLGATNLDELKASYAEHNSDEDEYSLVETTVNGYKALILKYSDFLGATMRVDIDFGGNHDGWYGLSFAVSGESLKDCDTDLVWAIIESMEVVK